MPGGTVKGSRKNSAAVGGHAPDRSTVVALRPRTGAAAAAAASRSGTSNRAPLDMADDENKKVIPFDFSRKINNKW